MAKIKTENKDQKQNNTNKSKRKPPINVGKRGRLIVRNLHFNCTENNLADYFGKYGDIIEINLPKNFNNKPKGFAFVEFKTRLSADKASLDLTGKEFMGRTIHVERAISKDRFLNQINRTDNESNDIEDPQKVEVDIKEELNESDLDSNENELNGKHIEEEIGETSNDAKQNVFKKPFEITKKKKARIIIRNLSFKTTEDKLQDYFSSYGEIIDLNLLRRVDNKLVGCAFIEFAKRNSAVKAILGTSGKPFLGRPIIVDWAIPAKEFKKINKKNKLDNVNVKEEVLSDEEEESKKADFAGIEDNKIKKEEDNSSQEESDDDYGVTVKEEDDSKSEEGFSDEDDFHDEEDEDDEMAKGSKKRKFDEFSEENEPKKAKFESHDVSEGRTVFIKNVPFSATNEDLKDCVKQFGPIFYALICVDHVTEHSKGTAFVKFKNKEDAEKCLSSGTNFTLNGSVLDPHLAIDRNKIKEMNDKKKEKFKDNRNIYLIKEGVVMAGTPAANGVSMADMAHRLQLEQLKTQMLKKLNMFVSRNRLIIHNLPPSFDDRKLRNLFFKHSRPNSVIQEAKVMRDLKNFDDKGQGKSKEYGFVSFKDHEDALFALRQINNNPNIFSIAKRPIVGFSIENKSIVNLKEKRLEKSKINNPLCPEYKSKKRLQQNVQNGSKNRDRFKNNKKQNNNLSNGNEVSHQGKNFIGFEARPGNLNKRNPMRSKYKLKIQAQLHNTKVKEEKKEKKKAMKLKSRSFRKEGKEKKIKSNKQRFDKDDANFSSLVNKYKKQLISLEPNKKKWYE